MKQLSAQKRESQVHNPQKKLNKSPVKGNTKTPPASGKRHKHSQINKIQLYQEVKWEDLKVPPHSGALR